MPDKRITLDQLQTAWLSKSAAYRPSAFWFWNAAMEPQEIEQTVFEMAANGVREFLVHPIHGLEIEYLSDEYFERLRLALRCAKIRGLKVWIYDEYGWPSGVAGGKLLREYPECRGWYLAFSRDGSGRVTAEPVRSDRILDNVIGAPWTRGERGYLDTLSVDAVRRFIDLTYERIHAECGDFFSDTIAGFFTDEPVTMMDTFSGIAGGWSMVGMPWTPGLLSRFREQFGRDIETRYAELADGHSPLKRDYWRLVKQMHREAYHAQIGAWCRGHGIKYTGHVGEDSLLMQVRFSGSIYQCLAEMDEPGIDFLGHSIEPEDRFIEHVTVCSAARHAGKSRVYCEAFGITPFDIRLSSMLRRSQMLAVYGVNDIALMGFHHSLAGVRKRTYWSPLFSQSPWWPFYPRFRDAFARSVSLAALGARRSRYALLYPQNQLEQTDVFFTDIWSGADPSTSVVKRLALAIYAAGETFDFVFPEILDQAQARYGSIAFPHAQYEALLAPNDLTYFDESAACLEALSAQGARVMRGPLDDLEAEIRRATPSWAGSFSIDTDAGPGSVRVFRFDYPDGELYALRNVTDSARRITTSSDRELALWDPTTGVVTALESGAQSAICPRSCLYLSVTKSQFGARAGEPLARLPVEAVWTAAAETPNTARFSGIQFYHHKLGWLDAAAPPLPAGPERRPACALPVHFAGEQWVSFRATFQCISIPETLGVIFESGYLESLSVNGAEIDLAGSVPVQGWDSSCRLLDVRPLVLPGANSVEGTLTFPEFETQVANHAFFLFHPMPELDLRLAGAFRLINGEIANDDNLPITLPLDLSASGWEQYSGIVRLSGAVCLSADLAAAVRGLSVEPRAEDCAELLIDGVSIGARIASPYHFEIGGLTPGRHVIGLRISSTSANLLDQPCQWGIHCVEWLVARGQ
ncbi:MAG: hypothetical protein Q7T82_04895 [Armatimonadota bacterium]|nr:hypothetical protein [Armatimonadota bacterium]